MRIRHVGTTNENMPNMFPIAYLNWNLRYYNENSACGNREPLPHSYEFWYTTRGEKETKTSFYFIFM